MLSTFTTRALNILIVVILNFLSNNFKIYAISGSDTCLFILFIAIKSIKRQVSCFVILLLLLKVRPDISGMRN